MSTNMFHLRILVFCQVGIWAISKWPLLLPGILLQVVICCLYSSIVIACITSFIALLLQIALSCSMFSPSSKRNHFYKKTKSWTVLEKLVLEEDKIIKDVKKSYPKVIPNCPLSIFVCQVNSKSVITPCFGRSMLSSTTWGPTKIVQSY
jgi:hypothetical protein